MPKPVSLTAAAATLGLSRNTLAGYLERGCPFVTKADRDRGVEWEIDTAAVFAWRVDEAVKDAVAGYQTKDGGMSKDEADRRRAIAVMHVAEVEADIAMKSVMSRFDGEVMMSDFCLALRSALSSVGAKVANQAAAMTRPAEIRDLCQNALNKAFGSAEADLRERWADDAKHGSEDVEDEDGA